MGKVAPDEKLDQYGGKGGGSYDYRRRYSYTYYGKGGGRYDYRRRATPAPTANPYGQTTIANQGGTAAEHQGGTISVVGGGNKHATRQATNQAIGYTASE